MQKKTQWYKTAQSPSVYQFDLQIDMPDALYQIIQSLNNLGYPTLIVGGAVRDSIMEEQNKDIDLEVYGIGYEELGEILNQYDASGKAKFVGKSFGIITIRDEEGNDYDFALPRRETKTGKGHKGFEVEFDESITPKEAASRRDFTMNSLSYNPITNEIHDYFGGVKDIENKILRAVGPAFAEDPLRALRGMQFAGRFNMIVEPETAEMIRGLKEEPLTKERISGEWMKLFTKGKYPSKGLQYLIDTGWSEVYPEIQSIVGVEQDPVWHPEGVLEIHTAFAMDAAADIALREEITGDDKAVLVASALCHDLGKPEVTFTDIDGKIKSPGHDAISAEKTQTLLDSLGIKKDIIDRVVPLVAQHMYHIDYEGTTKKNPIHLSETLNPATIKELIHVIEMDHAARPPSPAEIPDKVEQLREESIEKGVYENVAPPLIQGRDIMHLFDAPGPIIGQILKYIRDLQLMEKISTKEEAMDAAEKYIKKETSIVNGNDILSVIGGNGGPHIGAILNDAWEAQKQKIFTNKEEAIQWLQKNYLNPENTDMGEGDMIFSDKNMNYTKIALKIRKPEHEEVIKELCNIFRRGREDGSINWARVRYIINDDAHLDDIMEYWNADPAHCAETYEEYQKEIEEEGFREDVVAFVDLMEKTAQETEYGDVPDTVGGAGYPDISELESDFGSNAKEALDLAMRYNAPLFNKIVYIGSTNDSSVAGVYEPALTQEIVGEEEFQEGVAFRVSPTKIRSEVQRVTSSEVPQEDLREIEIMIIAEIMVHEASHAQGAEDEGTPVNMEREFLQKAITDKNQEREGLGLPPLPVDLKSGTPC